MERKEMEACYIAPTDFFNILLAYLQISEKLKRMSAPLTCSTPLTSIMCI